MQSAILKSFTYKGAGGNGAGVVLLPKNISKADMQQIAAYMNLSETAFIKKIDEINYDVKFFTPVCEVDLCGHATIASFYYLAAVGMIKGKNEMMTVYQNTNAGKLFVELYFKDEKVEYVLMQQQSPVIYKELKGMNKKDIAKSLNISDEHIRLDRFSIEPTIVSTGLKDILIPVKTREILNGLEPNFDMIKDISIKNDVVGYHVYTIEENQVYARNFAPAVGIYEECATGTSNGALGGLLHKKNILSGYFEIIQGEFMNQSSLICVSVREVGGKVNIKVGGRARIVTKKSEEDHGSIQNEN